LKSGRSALTTIHFFLWQCGNQGSATLFRSSFAGFTPSEKVALAVGNGGLLAILGPQCSRSLSEMVQAQFIQTRNYHEKRSPDATSAGAARSKIFKKNEKNTCQHRKSSLIPSQT
jgi:hypothetical protein